MIPMWCILIQIKILYSFWLVFIHWFLSKSYYIFTIKNKLQICIFLYKYSLIKREQLFIKLIYLNLFNPIQIL